MAKELTKELKAGVRGVEKALKGAKFTSMVTSAVEGLVDQASPDSDRVASRLVHAFDDKLKQTTKKVKKGADVANLAIVGLQLEAGTADLETLERGAKAAVSLLEASFEGKSAKVVKAFNEGVNMVKGAVASSSQRGTGAGPSRSSSLGSPATPAPPEVVGRLRSALNQGGAIDYSAANARGKAINKTAAWDPQKGAGGKGRG